MKKIILFITVLFVFAFLKTYAQQESEIDFNYFYTSLQPYGEWIELSQDLVVWHPNDISPRWRPYSLGRWNWTDQGWFWDSDEEFGWATYHYGRWFKDNNYGWIWVPGYDWAPAWVEWRHNNNYVGWAPLPPYATFNADSGISFSEDWQAPYENWNFVPYSRFNEPKLSPFILMEPGVERIFTSTTYSNNYSSDHGRIFNGGVDRSFLELRMGVKLIEKLIAPVESMHDYGSRGRQSDRVEVYRPPVREIEKNRENTKFNFNKGETSSSLLNDIIKKIDKRVIPHAETNFKPSDRIQEKNERMGERTERNGSALKQQENDPSANHQNNFHGATQQGNIPNLNQLKTGRNFNQPIIGTQPTTGTQPTVGTQPKTGRNFNQPITRTQPTVGTQPKTGRNFNQPTTGKQPTTSTQPKTGTQPTTGKQPTTGATKTPNKNAAKPAKEEDKKKQQ